MPTPANIDAHTAIVADSIALTLIEELRANADSAAIQWRVARHLQLLASTGSPIATEALYFFAETIDPRARGAFYNRISMLPGRARALAYLENAATDSLWGVAYSAIQALGFMGAEGFMVLERLVAADAFRNRRVSEEGSIKGMATHLLRLNECVTREWDEWCAKWAVGGPPWLLP